MPTTSCLAVLKGVLSRPLPKFARLNANVCPAQCQSLPGSSLDKLRAEPRQTRTLTQKHMALHNFISPVWHILVTFALVLREGLQPGLTATANNELSKSN